MYGRAHFVLGTWIRMAPQELLCSFKIIVDSGSMLRVRNVIDEG